MQLACCPWSVASGLTRFAAAKVHEDCPGGRTNSDLIAVFTAAETLLWVAQYAKKPVKSIPAAS